MKKTHRMDSSGALLSRWENKETSRVSNSDALRVAVLISSHRRDGNTEQLANLALENLPIAATIDRIRLLDYRFERFPDVRHAGRVLPDFGDDYDAVLDRVLAADLILFAAPVYWYSVPGVLKDFLDRFNGAMLDPQRAFKERMRGKIAYLVTMVADEDRRVALPTVESLRLTAAYLHMAWGGSVVGYGSRPGDVLRDAESVAEAKDLFANLPALLSQRED
jgi:multimeric flavodoxin WrbA